MRKKLFEYNCVIFIIKILNTNCEIKKIIVIFISI